MEEDNYNLLDLSTRDYIDYVRLKLVQLDQHIVALWRHPMIKDGLSAKDRRKFKDFFDEAATLVDESLYLEEHPHLTDDTALRNLAAEFVELMAKAKVIVSAVRVILDQP